MDGLSQAIDTHQVRVKMYTCPTNTIETGLMKAFPPFKRKQPGIWGAAGVGQIIAVGTSVARFRVGDHVCLLRQLEETGAQAAEVVLDTYNVALIPAHLTLEESALLVHPLLTAYEAINHLNVQPGESILVHCAGKGVGLQVVQLAKALGLKVIARACRRSRGHLLNCGVDEFIDERLESFLLKLSNRPPTYIFGINGEDELLDSIQLKPKTLISMGYLSQEQLRQTGIDFPLIYLSVFKLLMEKYEKAALENGVALIGHMSAGNGQGLAKAIALAAKYQFKVKLDQRLSSSGEESLQLTDQAQGKILLSPSVSSC